VLEFLSGKEAACYWCGAVIGAPRAGWSYVHDACHCTNEIARSLQGMGLIREYAFGRAWQVRTWVVVVLDRWATIAGPVPAAAPWSGGLDLVRKIAADPQSLALAEDDPELAWEIISG
jgi:hypothetical protein